MKTVKQTKRAKLKFTKTWGWHVVKKGGAPDGRDLEKGFGKGKQSEQNAVAYFNSIK